MFCFTARHASDSERQAQDGAQADDTPDENKKAPKLVVLVLHDRQTRFLEAIPVEHKGTERWLRHLSKEICRFASMLGYNDVVLRSDSEQPMKALHEMVTNQRLRVGLSTKSEYSPPCPRSCIQRGCRAGSSEPETASSIAIAAV